MSTDARIALYVLLALIGGACRREPAAVALGALCRAAAVETPVRLVVDSARAEAAAGNLRGRSFDLELAFRPGDEGEQRSECNGRIGRVAFEGKLPSELAPATASDRIGLWRIMGDTVAIDLNPSVRDNNLTLALPLGGGPGRWGLSTFLGEVMTGRVEPRE